MFEQMLSSVIQSHGSFGLLSVMILQTIVAPIPSEALLVFSGTIGMKLFDIILWGGIGLIIGSIIAFYISRLYGKPIIIKLIGGKWVDRVDKWVSENGTMAIFVTRLIPFVPFDLISYMSGITSLDFKHYLLATVLGAFPRTMMLALMGITAKSILSWIGISLEITFVAGMLGLFLLAYLDRKGYLGFIEDSIIVRVIKKRLVKT